jgi:hypothetical protein
MTTIAVSPKATARAGVDTRRSKPVNPTGIPSWLGFLGVAVLPVSRPDGSGTRAWVVSVGAGTTGMAALVFDTPEHHRTDTTRRDQT